jgi:hypothetical protein
LDRALRHRWKLLWHLQRAEEPHAVYFCLGEVFSSFICDAPSAALDRYGMRISHDAAPGWRFAQPF